MACEPVKTADGITAIVCTLGKKKKDPCHICRKPATVLCDHPVTTRPSGTCDQPCCRTHSENVGENKDYCLSHWQFAQKLKEAQVPELPPIEKRMSTLLNLIAETIRPCRACGEQLAIVRHRNDKLAPYTMDGTNHFINCPKADQFRQKNGGAE